MLISGEITAQQRLAQIQTLSRQGRIRAALALIQSAPAAEQAALNDMKIGLLKAGQHYDDLLAIRNAQVTANPASVVSHHNLASTLGDAGKVKLAETSARKALSLGGKAPETFLVLARALQAQNRTDEALAAYSEVISRRPDYVEAIAEQAQLLWMTGQTVEKARAPFTAALMANPHHPGLLQALSVFNLFVGMPSQAVWQDLTARLKPGPVVSVVTEMAAANVALEFDPDLGLNHARRATEIDPSSLPAWTTLAKAQLVAGQEQAAAEILKSLVQAAPQDQLVLALHATAMRKLGRADPLGLDDADGLIRASQIDVPPGWDSLPAYLHDLARALETQHGYSRHPIGQSLRQGSQTPIDLRRVDDPVIQSFFTAIDRPIRDYLKHLGRANDPVRGRNTGEYRINGCWSVRLKSGGFHEAHIHGQGWLSSACYIELPEAIDRGGTEGWIGFGVPPFSQMAPLEPLKVEKPEPGKLVLFPSCMWHGTLPFEDERHRLTIAFDIVPE
jgi:tetratricopeptide (TPR) repeat protein